jgi:hypothetical protein
MYPSLKNTSYWTEEQGKDTTKRKLAKGFISSARKKSRRWKKSIDDDDSEEDVESNILPIPISLIRFDHMYLHKIVSMFGVQLNLMRNLERALKLSAFA